MKYPFVILYRHKSYKAVDTFFEKFEKDLNCTVFIINEPKELNRLYDCNNQILLTYGNKNIEYIKDLTDFLPKRIIDNKWIHIDNFFDLNCVDENIVKGYISYIDKMVNDRYITNVCGSRESCRPVFSIFTTCYNSYQKIFRAYESFLTQKFIDWEWVILDDSPDEKHFDFLKENFSKDKRVRMYRRSENSGSIGNVKNEVVMLCRGKYVLEMDHDDEILPDTLKDAVDVFEKDPEVGFVYMDFCNLYENGNNFKYGDFFGLGYAGYHCVKFRGKWVFVENTPNINNITISHLVSLPNHPRIWRKDTLMKLGNYSEELPICDDQEILMRSAMETKCVKISKMGYVQYMNEGNNNFSLIRNWEINRIGPHILTPIFYDKYKVHEKMKEMGAYEDESFMRFESLKQMWLRGPEYEHKYCNKIVNPDCNKQYCIIGFEYIVKNKDKIMELYSNPKNELFLLDSRYSNEYFGDWLDYMGLSRMKFYRLENSSKEELMLYFKFICRNCDDYEYLTLDLPEIVNNSVLGGRHEVIIINSKPENKYLEIGVETGYTFNNVHFYKKTGVDPDPKFSHPGLKLLTSDEFFAKNRVIDTDTNKITNKETYDVIFIDGMHQSEYVMNDFNNSLECLNDGGKIMIDDILPLSYNEQLRIPIKHYYENGILKYGEPWTGDVWKTVYYILKHHNDKMKFKYYTHSYYRGVGVFIIKEKFQIPENAASEIKNYDYFVDFPVYYELIKKVEFDSRF